MSKFALLIGIDRYDYRHVPENLRSKDEKVTSITFHDLRGAVNDVLKMRIFLIDTLGIPEENVTTLIAPVKGVAYPYSYKTKTNDSVPLDQVPEPTYQNIVCELQRFAEVTKAGDMVFFHYSGHGMRAKTAFGDLKATQNAYEPVDQIRDECIVPCDFAHNGKLLRDVELGALLQDIAGHPDRVDGQKAALTVVVDCCHSGGTLRGEDSDAERGVRFIADEYLSDKSDAHIEGSSLQQSINRWQNLGLWDSDLKGFVVLVACFERQKAYEGIFGTQPRVIHGQLSYWLLETISQQSSSILAFGSVHDAVRANMVQNIQNQEPYVIGDSTRSFFDEQLTKWVPRPYVTKVTQINTNALSTRSVTISAGALHGVSYNSVYGILSQEDGKTVQEARILACVRVIDVEPEECIATFLGVSEDIPWDKIRKGCPTMLLRLDDDFQPKVLLRDFTGEQFDKFAESWQRAQELDSTFETIVQSQLQLVAHPDCWNQLHEKLRSLIQPLTTGETAPLTISIFNNEYHIDERLDNFSGLKGLRCDDNDDFDMLIDRLQHMARINLLSNLANNLTNRDLEQVSVTIQVPPELKKRQNEYGQYIYDGRERVKFQLVIENKSTLRIAFIILNVGSDLGSRIIYPQGSPFAVLNPGESWQDILQLEIPNELRDCEAARGGGDGLPDLLKIFLTNGHDKDFRSLQLQPIMAMEGARGTNDDSPALSDAVLDQVLQCFGPPARNVELVKSSAWKAVDIHFRTRLHQA